MWSHPPSVVWGHLPVILLLPASWLLTQHPPTDPATAPATVATSSTTFATSSSSTTTSSSSASSRNVQKPVIPAGQDLDPANIL